MVEEGSTVVGGVISADSEEDAVSTLTTFTESTDSLGFDVLSS